MSFRSIYLPIAVCLFAVTACTSGSTHSDADTLEESSTDATTTSEAVPQTTTSSSAVHQQTPNLIAETICSDLRALPESERPQTLVQMLADVDESSRRTVEGMVNATCQELVYDTSVTTTIAKVNVEEQKLIWAVTFENTYLEGLQEEIPHVLEDLYYWIESIDRLSYDRENNVLIIEATVDSVSLREPQEWRNDTWELVRDLSLGLWEGIATGVEAMDEGDQMWDWIEVAPGLSFYANEDTLTVDCPGRVIHLISQSELTQAEFEVECRFNE